VSRIRSEAHARKCGRVKGLGADRVVDLDAEELIALIPIAGPMSGTEIVFAVMQTHRVRDYVIHRTAKRVWPTHISADQAVAEVTNPFIASEDLLALVLVELSRTPATPTLLTCVANPPHLAGRRDEYALAS
jgi:hypothetical protein